MNHAFTAQTPWRCGTYYQIALRWPMNILVHAANEQCICGLWITHFAVREPPDSSPNSTTLKPMYHAFCIERWFYRGWSWAYHRQSKQWGSWELALEDCERLVVRPEVMAPLYQKWMSKIRRIFGTQPKGITTRFTYMESWPHCIKKWIEQFFAFLVHNQRALLCTLNIQSHGPAVPKMNQLNNARFW